MAQISMNAYDADVFIPEFKGLMQYGDQMGTDLRYSPDCMNVETPSGVLQPSSLPKDIELCTNSDGTGTIDPADACTLIVCRCTVFGAQPLMSNYYWAKIPPYPAQRFAMQIPPNNETDNYIVIIGNKLYLARLPVDLVGIMYGTQVTHDMIVKIEMNIAYTFTYEDNWSWCTYEVDYGEPGPHDPPGSPSGRTNVVIMTSEKNGIFCFNGATIDSISNVPTSFRHVARFAERIWGVGVGENKDCIYYSRPYSFTNWSQDNDDPANGGGEIREATFDKDRILALVPFGDSLIAFSEQRAWKITGSDPSNFTIQEQYGNGTRFPKSIGVLGNRIIMLSEHGLVSYDGYQVSPFLKEATYEMLREPQLNKENGFGLAVGAVTNHKYILTLGNRLKYASSAVSNNDYRYLIFDELDGTTLVTESPYITDLCADFPGMCGLIYNSESKMGLIKMRFDSWYLNDTFHSRTKWVSPWITFGRKDIQKGGFELYLYPELERHDDSTAEGVTFKITIETEKKSKVKYYRALYNEQGKYKQKRLHFGGAGRRFRVTIETGESADGSAETNLPAWRLIGGIHIIAETDKD